MKRATMIALSIISVVIFASAAQSQATRTWVSGVGDDVNPCSRTAPCKTFAGAISKTATAGEINCLDPGGFGAVTITKSLTIDCTGEGGGILASLTTGVIINSSTAEVKLRNLNISAPGNGVDGIRIISAASVTIENVTISGFTSNAIELVPTAGATATRLQVSRATIFNNNIGLLAQSSSAIISAAIDNSNFTNNVVGLVASDNSRITCVDCTASDNQIGFQAQTLGIGTVAELSLESCIASENRTLANATGVTAGGGGGSGTSRVRLSNVGIYNNTVGFSVFAGGIINTFSNNKIDGNGSNTGALTPLAVQ